MNNSIKPISKALSILFMAGGALMVISAGCFVFFWHRALMCWIFLLGAVLFTLVQAQQSYQGDDLPCFSRWCKPNRVIRATIWH